MEGGLAGAEVRPVAGKHIDDLTRFLRSMRVENRDGDGTRRAAARVMTELPAVPWRGLSRRRGRRLKDPGHRELAGDSWGLRWAAHDRRRMWGVLSPGRFFGRRAD
jgi:hypothetical protein